MAKYISNIKHDVGYLIVFAHYNINNLGYFNKENIKLQIDNDDILFENRRNNFIFNTLGLLVVKSKGF